MRLTVIGCSGSFAGPTSPASCYLVTAEHEGRDWHLLLDLGNGALGALQRHLDPAALDAIMISHLHPDHCLDLTGLYVMRTYDPRGAHTDRLPVYGPAGTGTRLAAAYEGMYEVDFDRVFDSRRVADGIPFRLGPFTVTPHLVNHPVEAYGVRVEAGGRALAYTGDTDSCDALLTLMEGVDLALTDSAFIDGRDHIEGIHLSGSRAATAAMAAGAKRLMLTHIPAWNDPEVCRAQAAAVWTGEGREVELAAPDTTYEI